MVCPHCGLVNTPNAQRCDCGYDFEDREIRGPYLSAKERELSRTKKLKWLPAAALIIIVLAFLATLLRYEPVFVIGALVLVGALFPYIWKSL